MHSRGAWPETGGEANPEWAVEPMQGRELFKALSCDDRAENLYSTIGSCLSIFIELESDRQLRFYLGVKTLQVRAPRWLSLKVSAFGSGHVLCIGLYFHFGSVFS